MKRWCTTCLAETNFSHPSVPWEWFEEPERIVTCDECQSEQMLDKPADSHSKDAE